MSVSGITVPDVEDLTCLAAAVTEFAAGNNLMIVPAVPEHDYGPEVCLSPDALDLPGFLALAGKLGGGVLYLQAVPFDPGSDDDQPEDPPAQLVGHKGQTGQVSVAFAANGVLHFWEHRTAWYRSGRTLPRASRRGATPTWMTPSRQSGSARRIGPGWPTNWPARYWPTRSSGPPHEVTGSALPGWLSAGEPTGWLPVTRPFRRATGRRK